MKWSSAEQTENKTIMSLLHIFGSNSLPISDEEEKQQKNYSKLHNTTEREQCDMFVLNIYVVLLCMLTYLL